MTSNCPGRKCANPKTTCNTSAGVVIPLTSQRPTPVTNDGTLTAKESRELDALVAQFEQKTLDMTRALKRCGEFP
jgi:hypothetical protein